MPPCGDAPIQACLWSPVDPNTPQNIFWRIISSIALHKQACMGVSPECPHTAARPPQTGCPASTGIGAADGHPTGQARPRGYLGPACSVGGQSVPVVRVSGGRKNAFFGGCARGCAPHTKLHVKSEGGMGCTRVFQNRVVQTVPASLPPKAIWRPKPTLKEGCSTVARKGTVALP